MGRRKAVSAGSVFFAAAAVFVLLLAKCNDELRNLELLDLDK